METRPPLRQLLFGSWERKYNLITIVLSILSPIISLFILRNPDQVPTYIIYRDVIIVFILIGADLFLLIKYLQIDNLQKEQERKLQNQINKEGEKESAVHRTLSAQLKFANGIVRLASQEVFDRYKTNLISKMEIPADPEEYNVFNAICAAVTPQVRDAIKEYLESLNIKVYDDISVSVKLILPSQNILDLYPEHFSGGREKLEREKALNEEQLWVITAFRDSRTFREHTRSGEREVLTTLYSIERNTAFRNIFSGRTNSFQADNLSELYRRGLYQNENPHWQKHYNSTLVVPLVLEHFENDKRRYLGFLTVDSLNSQVYHLYEREECYWIMNHAALVLSNYFIAQILYHDVESNLNP